MSDSEKSQEPSKPKNRARRSFLKKAVAVGAGAAAVAAGVGAIYEIEKPKPTPFTNAAPIKHWIMIFQENRTFSMYFTNYPGAKFEQPSRRRHHKSR
jgi:phospholipase C